MATIQKRGNSYKIVVSCGYDLNYKQIRRSMTWTPEPGMTERQIKKELDRQAVLFEERCRTGQVLDGNIKFADFAEKWFTDYAEKQLRPRTVQRYRDMMQRINAAIGHIRVDRLQPHHLMQFYSNLEESGVRSDSRYKAKVDLSEVLRARSMQKKDLVRVSGACASTITTATNGEPIAEKSAQKIAAALEMDVNTLFEPVRVESGLSSKTIAHHHRLISSILSTAVKWQVILSNPCERVQPPRIERTETKYLDENQAAHMLALLDREPIFYRTAIKLLLYLGLRRGELCGLEWHDIDFEHSVICIRRTSQYISGRGIFTDETKNRSSERAIKAPEDAIATLRQFKAWQMQQRLSVGDQWTAEWDEHPRLFTTWNGKPINPNNITVWFERFIKRNDLPPISVHGLRHSNASILIAEGVNLQTVAARLGHADVATTTKIYSHAIKSADAAAAQTLQDIFKAKRA